jgi:hypothetical protein
MNKWLQKQIGSGFADLKGTLITARVPLRDAVINELIGEALAGATSGSSTPPAAASGIDMAKLLTLVEKAEVQASEGAITLNVVIKV